MLITLQWSPKDGILTTRMGKGKYGIVAFHSVNPSTDAHLLERAHWDETSDVELLRDLYKVSSRSNAAKKSIH